MKVDRDEIRPITDILGLAVLDSQRLEYSISYMMLLSKNEFDFRSKEHDEIIDDFMLNLSKKTLGTLIAKLKRIIEISENFEFRLNEALDARNYLIHRFYNDQVENLLTVEGRKAALEVVKEKRKILVECYFFLDPFIQILMKLRGFTMEDFLGDLRDKFEPDI